MKNIQILKRLKIVSEYDQEIPQSQTADNPVAPHGRAAQPSRDTRKTWTFFYSFCFLFKSFVKVELSYVFIINMFTIA